MLWLRGPSVTEEGIYPDPKDGASALAPLLASRKVLEVRACPEASGTCYTHKESLHSLTLALPGHSHI